MESVEMTKLEAFASEQLKETVPSFNVGDSLVIVTTDRGSIQQLNDIFA